jgi:subtilisin family serine protease
MSQAERPHIFSISLTQDMCDRDPGFASGTCWTRLPRDFEHIGDELALAVSNGITVVAGSGNGDYGFPAAMKQVIAVGGAEVDPSQAQPPKVWSEGSAFSSKITEGDCADRFVPDICGLAGGDRGAYIVLPVPPGSEYEREFPLSPALPAGSGWALFSGTSAATAQVAGVCALILQQRPDLEPRHLRNLLRNTAREVAEGKASRFSNLPDREGLAATAGSRDDADGFGLVDAFEAVESVNDLAALAQPRAR